MAEIAAHIDSGVIHEDVEPTVGALDPREKRRHVLDPTNVGGAGRCPKALAGNLDGCLLGCRGIHIR